MNRYIRALTVSLAIVGVPFVATTLARELSNDSAQKDSKSDHKIVKATYLISGLHCQGCTRTVESSLSRAEGIHKISVDWKTKTARIEYDPAELSEQQIARLVQDTPHMMGRGMHYDGWLLLKAHEIENDSSGKAAQAALQRIEGVKNVALYPKQHAIGVQFATKGRVTELQLIKALAAAGYHAANP